MRILITGATGFVGQKLAWELFRQGHDLVLLTRRKNNLPSIPGEWVEWKADQPVNANSLGRIDAVINLMGENIAGGRWTAARKRAIRASRSESVKNLLLPLAKREDLKVVLSASAIGIYGDRAEQWLNEDDISSNSDFLADVCKEWEQAVQTSLPKSIRTVIFRIGVVLGREGGLIEKTLPLFKGGVGAPLGSGKQYLSWIHQDDLVHAFIHALNHSSLTGTYNAVAPQPVSNQEFSKCFASLLGVRLLPNVPPFVLHAMYGEMASFVVASTRVSCQRLLDTGFKFKYESSEAALSEVLNPVKQNELLECSQWLPRSPEAVFKFFSNEQNLEKITPPFLNFRVLRKSTPQIEAGTLIYYRLKVRGFPISWTTRIESWNPNQSFTDFQLKGPYRLWHHTHYFEPLRNGTYMRDTVRYELPLGALGRCVGLKWVKSDVEKIFNYRKETIEHLLKEGNI